METLEVIYSSSPDTSCFYDDSFTESQTSDFDVHVKKCHHATEFLSAMQDMKDERDLIDLDLQVGNNRYSCHKAMLVAGSPYYGELLSGVENQQTSELTERELKSDMVRNIIKYVYTGVVTISKENASDLLQACYQHNIFRGKPVENAVSNFLARLTLGAIEDPSESDSVFHEFHFAAELLKVLNEQRKDEYLTDIVISAGGEDFPCHKFVLAATSNYFKAMFSSKMRETHEGRITLERIHPSILKALINYTYTGKLTINRQNAQEILRIACYLQLPSAMAACTEFIRDELHPSNCMGILQFAIDVGCQELCKEAMTYSLLHFLELVEFDEFKETTMKLLCQFIEDDNLNVKKEESVYNAVMMWVRHDKENRQYMLGDLLRRVRLVLVDMAFIQTNIQSDPLINRWPCVLEMIDTIKKLKLASNHGEKIEGIPMKLRFSMKKEVLVTVCGYTDNQEWVRDVQYYNPEDGVWRNLAPFPGRNQRFQCVAVDNDIYIIGGQAEHHMAHLSETLSDVWKYSSLTDTWSQVTKLNKPRHGHGAAVLDGVIYVVGGKIGWSKKFNEVERYDPKLNIWTTIGRIKGNFIEKPVVVAHEGKLYIRGYFFRDPDILHCFDPSTNMWTQIIINHCIQGDGIENAITLNDDIYYMVFRGYDNHVIAYDVPESTHRRGSVMPGGRYLHSYGVTSIGGNIFVTGGSKLDAGINIAFVECYKPDMDAWVRVDVMPLPLCEHGCVTIHKYIEN